MPYSPKIGIDMDILNAAQTAQRGPQAPVTISIPVIDLQRMLSAIAKLTDMVAELESQVSILAARINTLPIIFPPPPGSSRDGFDNWRPLTTHGHTFTPGLSTWITTSLDIYQSSKDI